MVINTFFTKNNTIVKNSTINTAKNPVVELYYGRNESSRYIFSIDFKSIFNTFLLSESRVKRITDLKHVLRMFNTSFFDYTINDNTYLGYTRASSFDLVLYKLEESFDEGIGYDKNTYEFNVGKAVFSDSPSNYFHKKTGTPWNNKFCVDTRNILDIKYFDDGEVDIDFRMPVVDTMEEYNKIVAIQHFESGKENLELDVSDHINAVLIAMYNAYLYGDKEDIHNIAENNNFCLAFTPKLEIMPTEDLYYVGFFSKYANSSYSPFVQSENPNIINDNRTSFYDGNLNRLYLFNRKGKYMYNADYNPTVTITLNPDSKEDPIVVFDQSEVFNPMEGIYFIEVELEEGLYGECDVIYDIWDFNVNGISKTVEQSFTVKQYEDLDKKITLFNKGLDRDERINRGERKKIFINPKIKYTSNQYDEDVDIFYRIYTKEGIRELPLVEYRKLHKIPGGSQFFFLDSLGFLPNTYFIDIKTYRNGENEIKKEFLSFLIVDTNKLDKHEPNKNYIPNIKNDFDSDSEENDDKYIIDITDQDFDNLF